MAGTAKSMQSNLCLVRDHQKVPVSPVEATSKHRDAGDAGADSYNLPSADGSGPDGADIYCRVTWEKVRDIRVPVLADI
jgi:hypothetical protein